MPNDILKAEFDTLREIVLELDRAEKAYYILLEYKDMPVREIWEKLRNRLMTTSDIRDDVKVSLAWTLCCIENVNPDYDFNRKLAYKAFIINKHKKSLEAKLLALFTKMASGNNSEYMEFASGFLEDMNEASLYTQVLEYDNILKMQDSSTPDGESLPGTTGRGVK